MNVLWIFFILIFFCIYVLLGLHITEGINSSVQVLLAWVVYTIMCTTFLNVFLLGYFWSVIQYKTGPTGQRGPSGETGLKGIQGTCGIDATEVFLIKALTDYIDAMYHSKTNTHIVNDNYKFTNNFLNNKIAQTAGSRQYKVLVANLTKDNKPVINLINYLKSIWKQWFELIYDSTEQPGSWFTDEFGNDIDNYGWLGPNPFDEIRKYDVYYWGLTRNFRPLKAEICRSTVNHGDAKFPNSNRSTSKNTQAEPRLKVIKTNDYYETGKVSDSDYNIKGRWWSPKVQNIGNDKYYPSGDIMTYGDYDEEGEPEQNSNKKGNTYVGNQLLPGRNDNGPDMKTILISGDVVDPITYTSVQGTKSDYESEVYEIVCPDGYTALGDVVVSHNGYTNGEFNQYKCVPNDCVTEIGRSNTREWTQGGGNDDPAKGDTTWNKYDRYYRSAKARWDYTWYGSINSLNNWDTGKLEADTTNGYNVLRNGEGGKPFYKLNKTCLERVPNTDFPDVPKYPTPAPETKEVEKEFADLGIGWYGHPYKLDPKYSIFTYLNLVPEGMIVNQGTGQRYYIVHTEGNDINLFNILVYNKKTTKYDGSLQALDYDKNGTGFTIKPSVVRSDNANGYYVQSGVVDQNESTMNAVMNHGNPIKRIEVTTLNTTKKSQQWKIILNPQNKKLLKLKNLYTNTYLYLSQNPLDGAIVFTMIDLDNYTNDPAFSDLSKDELDNRTNFSFIPSFGTHLNIIDNDNT